MERITIEELENMVHDKFVCTCSIKLSNPLFGDNKKHELVFDIFDGFAYCPSYNGKEYYAVYPKKKFVESSKVMGKELREFLELEENAPITELNCFEGYMILKENI